MKAFAITVEEEGKTFCRDCEEWFDGKPVEWVEIEVSYSGDKAEFDLDEAITDSYTMLRGECGCGREEPEDNCFDIFSQGEEVYQCGVCNDIWDNMSDAVACCQPEDD